MKTNHTENIVIDSIEAYHDFMQIEKPLHPLMSIIELSKTEFKFPEEPVTFVNNLYNISLKENAACVIRYGPHHFDYSQGVMSFFKPGQLLAWEPHQPSGEQGFMITFHPDFVRSYPLGQKLKDYHFFDYEVNEALFISDKEKVHIRYLMEGIKQEYDSNIDVFSQDAIISFIDLLLVYSNRYYNRQFITRKPQNDPVILKFEKLLDDYFSKENALQSGLPNVKYFAQQLNMSPNYLSDMLRVATGQSAQSHIGNRIIEEAKSMLSTSQLTVAEIAYQLGFEQPQSLNRLFKKKTDMSPLEYRKSFH